MPFVMLKIKQHLCLKVAIQKFFNKDYGKYQDIRSANSVNMSEMNAAENDWTDWQFSVSQALLYSESV